MELITYIFMACGAFVALTTRHRGITFAWYVSFIVYAFVVRFQPPTFDMIAYTTAIETWPPPLIPYTLREPLIWLGASLLYEIVNNRVATFLIIDIIIAALVIHAMNRLDDGDGRMRALAPTILTSYISLMGLQNAWRLYIAFVIVLWAIAARSRNERRFFLLFGLSMLAHNATALLFGHCFDLNRSKDRQYGPLITAVSVVSVALLQPYLGKSSTAHGLHTELLYIAVAIFIGSLLIYSNIGRQPTGGTSALFNFFAFVPAIWILGSSQFERMAMMFLVLILIDICRHHRSVKIGRFEVSVLSYIVLVAPVFMFPNALQMLLI